RVYGRRSRHHGEPAKALRRPIQLAVNFPEALQQQSRRLHLRSAGKKEGELRRLSEVVGESQRDRVISEDLRLHGLFDIYCYSCARRAAAALSTNHSSEPCRGLINCA